MNIRDKEMSLEKLKKNNKRIGQIENNKNVFALSYNIVKHALLLLLLTDFFNFLIIII